MDLETLLYYISTCGVALFISWKLLLRQRRGGRISGSGLRPPMAPIGFFECVNAFFSRDSPFFLLKLSRDMNQKVFDLPIAPPGSHFFCVADPTVARDILSDPRSTKPRDPYKFFNSVAGGENFFTDNGPRFAHVRKATNPAFSTKNVELMSTVLQQVVDEWMHETLIPLYINLDKPIDLAQELPHVTAQVAGRAVFDYAFTREERDLIIDRFRIALIEFQTNSQKNPLRQLPFIGSLLFPGVRKGRKATNELRQVARRMIEKYRSLPQRKPEKMIDMIVHDTMYASDEERISDVVLYMAGGFDSTAYTLSWAMLELAKNPREQEKLYKALQKRNKSHNDCPELKMLMREIHRLHPAASLGSMRVNPEDYTFLSEHGEKWTIPKNSLVLTPYFLMGRNDKLFQDADSFVPSRWENPTDDQLNAVIPFSLGKRNCQGQALARLELETIVSKVLENFELSIVKEGTADYFMTLKPVGSLVSIKKRRRES